MTNTEQQSAAVTASGVIAILGSVFTVIGILFALVALFVAASVPNAPSMVPAVRLIATLMMLAFLAVALFGIACGVGLIRFRNWARISTLVWSGIAAPICLAAMTAMLLIPLPPTPSSPIPNFVLRLIVCTFYGAPLAIAAWWLILFTRPRIIAQFRAAAPSAAGATGDPFTALPSPANAPVDDSGFTSTIPATYSPPSTPPRPSIPLPIIVLSCFFLIGAASIFLIFFVHIPAMVFGRAFTGLTGSTIYATWCLLYAIAGIGMLRRVSWAYSVAIAVQILSIISGIMTVLSPNFDSMMRRAMINMDLPPPEVYSSPSMAHLRGFSVMGLIFPLAILGLLAYYRPRFLEACAAKTQNPSGEGDSTMPGGSPEESPTPNVEPAS
jgi:hypothetical protein